MSRRKQSNPKPLKRRTEDELEELSRSHQLPADVLQVREVEPETEGSGSTGDLGVFTPYPLAKGSCIFGPFKVTEAKPKIKKEKQDGESNEAEEDSKEEQLEENLLEFTSSEGGVTVTVRVQSEGRWLKLIRPSLRPQDANVTICLQGTSLVWCEITEDIKEEHELLATCRREPEPVRRSSSPNTQQETTTSRTTTPTSPEASAAHPCTTPSPTPPRAATPVAATLRSTAAPSSPSAVSVKSEEGSVSSLGGHSPVTASAMVVKSSVLRPTTPNLGRPEPDSRSPIMLERKGASPEHGTSPQPPRYPLIYGCVHCGVKFSNPRTLAAHVEFYCSKKAVLTEAQADTNSGDGMEVDRVSHKSSDEMSYKQRPGGMDPLLTQMKREQLSPASSRRSDGERSTNSTPKEKHIRRLSSGDDSTDGPAAKIPKMGHNYQCPFCSYSADKKISLNRHLRMHNSSDESNSRSQTTSPTEMEDFNSSENFCRECNIQFSSRKTFMGHKEFYCATRRRTDGGGEGDGSLTPQPATAAATQAAVELQQQMASFLPTQAAAYAVQSFLRSPGASQTMGSLLGQHPAIVVAAPMMAPSGVGNINTPTVILQPVIAMPHNMVAPARLSQVLPPNPLVSQSAALPTISGSSSPNRTSPQAEKGDAPLDLSCKREAPPAPRAASAEPERLPKSPSREPPDPQKESSEPQDLSVKREWRTPTSERSPPTTSPSGRETSVGRRSPEGPPEGVTGIPPPTAEMLAAQAHVMSMMTQHAAAAAMMLAPPHISKCLECNIVFYKHENFLIHKEHYCAGRRISKRERMLAKEMSPGSATPVHPDQQGARNGSLTPTSESRSPGHCPSLSPRQATPPELSLPVAPAGSNKTDIPPMDHTFLQFYCIPCKIKFSSIDTLTAHQEFYCPFNKENHTENGTGRQHRLSPGVAPEPDVPQGSSRPDSGSGSDAQDSQEGDVYACPHCGHTYPSYRLLKLHFCKAASAHMPLLRCPYCEFITQSDNRLVEHIRSHAPTKAYRCTICGYRGNTVRGMRMHGKTHVDEGQPFSDENMVEYEEPPLIPRRHRTAAVEANPVNMEVELIRLKNEPYKRRRSRKGYEKAENFSPVRRQPPHVCMTCNEAFSDTGRLRQHMRVHMQEATYACRSCDLVTNDKASLVRHVKRVHESSLRSSMDDLNDSSCEPIDVRSRNTDSIDSNVSMKREVIEENERGGDSPIGHHSDLSRSAGPSPDVEGAKVADHPPHSPVQQDTRPGSDGQKSPPEPIVIKPEKIENDVNQNRCPSNESPSDCHAQTPSPHKPADNNTENINMDRGLAKTRAPHTPPPSGLRKQSSSPAPHLSASREATLRRPTTPLSPVNGSKPELSATELLIQKKGDKSGVNYCKQCDITFVYMSSFMAHKQYYCSSHAGERDCPQTEVS